jgi:hypothetical protein
VPQFWRAWRAAPSAPTETRTLGSGEPDFGLGAAADTSRGTPDATATSGHPVSPITDGDLTLNPIFTSRSPRTAS